MAEFERLVLSGSPRERGRRHGERFAEAVATNVETYRNKFTHQGLDPGSVRDQAVEYIDVIEADAPEYIEEMRGIADGSDVPLADVAMLNVRWEVIYSAWKEMADGEQGTETTTRREDVSTTIDGCTSIGVTPPASADGRTYIGQNWDWLVPLEENLFLAERHRENGPDSLAMTEAGIVGGKIGVNEAGIGLCVNGLISPTDGENSFRTPYHVRFYRILEADRFDDAIRPILEGERVCSANVVVGDAGGEVLDLEAAPDRVEALYPEEGLLTHANHFESGCMESVGEKEIPSTLYRASRSRKLLSTDRGEIGTEILRSALQDHFGNPSSICKHTDESLPEVERKQTNASFIIDLENRRLLATRGPPCRSEYREYAL